MGRILSEEVFVRDNEDSFYLSHHELHFEHSYPTQMGSGAYSGGRRTPTHSHATRMNSYN